MSELQAYRTLIDYASTDLRSAIEAVPDDLFDTRPTPTANPVSFIYFHVLRHWDRDINVRILGKDLSEDTWHQGNFSELSGYNPDGKGNPAIGSGLGYSQAEVSEMTAGKDVLLRYQAVLLQETHTLLDELTKEDLLKDRPSPSGTVLTTAGRLQHLVAHTYVHVGDIEYIKGLIGAPNCDVPNIG